MTRCCILSRPVCWLFALAILALPQVTLAQAQWPEFRGPHGNGHASASSLPETWSEEDVTWKTAIPGRGWSSPVIADDQVWITTAIANELTGEEREEKLANAPIPGMNVFGDVSLRAICLDRESGSIVHNVEVFKLPDPPLIHSLNSFASPTPVIYEGRVYVNFGTFGSACLERETGSVVWKNEELKLDHETGPGSSPIVWQDLMILNCDGIDQQYVAALNRSNGTVAWKTERSGELEGSPSYKKAFSTPIIIDTESGSVLVSSANWVYGYDPKTGNELWKLPYGKLGFSTVPRPLFDGKRLFVCTGYMKGSLLAISMPDSAGQPGEIDWRHEEQIPNMPSPILANGMLFFASDSGVATCLDADTGEQHWRERLGGKFSASPILADGKLYFGNREGKVYVVAPTAEFDLRGTNELDADIMASPAAVGQSLYFRTSESLYRINR